MEPTAKGALRLDLRGSTMTQLALRLSRLADRTVVDKAAVPGQFNFHLEFTPDTGMRGLGLPMGRDGDAGATGASNTAEPPADFGPGLFAALQEQIGLKLAPDKEPVSFLVIDHAEKPTAN